MEKFHTFPKFSGQMVVMWFHLRFGNILCLLSEGYFTHAAILHGMRESMRSKARSVLVNLGPGHSPYDILDELECVYGEVSSTERINEKFYAAFQQPGESLVNLSIRFEEIISHLPLTRVTKNDMLCSRLWAGLRDTDLRNFSRFKVEAVSDFNQLRKVLRELEDDFKSTKPILASIPATISFFSNVSSSASVVCSCADKSSFKLNCSSVCWC